MEISKMGWRFCNASYADCCAQIRRRGLTCNKTVSEPDIDVSLALFRSVTDSVFQLPVVSIQASTVLVDSPAADFISLVNKLVAARKKVRPC